MSFLRQVAVGALGAILAVVIIGLGSWATSGGIVSVLDGVTKATFDTFRGTHENLPPLEDLVGPVGPAAKRDHLALRAPPVHVVLRVPPLL